MISSGLPAPLNLTLVSGAEKVIEVQVSNPDGSFRDMSYYTFRGEAQGVDGSVREIAAWVDADSPDVVLMRIPALAEGRYRYSLSAAAEDGAMEALISGVLGVNWPIIEGEAQKVASPNRRLVLRFPEELTQGVARWVGTTWLDAAVETAREATDKLAVVDKRLEQAEAFEEAFNEKVTDFVVPNEKTGTWFVGGMDTGKPWQGEKGADGTSIQRINIGSENDLPNVGNGGVYYYVGGKTKGVTIKPGDSVYLHVENAALYPAYCGLSISTYEVTVPAYSGLADWVGAINKGFDFIVNAELVDVQTIKISNIADYSTSVVIVNNYSDTYYLQTKLGYDMFVWMLVDGRGKWVKVDTVNDYVGVPDATYATVGGVQLLSTLDDTTGPVHALPTKAAIRGYVTRRLNEYVKTTALTQYAKLDELDNYATKADLDDVATQEDVNQAVAELENTTYSKEEADERFLGESEAKTFFVSSGLGKPTVINVLTREAFNALSVRDPQQIYFIKR